MSELKSYDLVDIQDYRGEVYLKTEADKVIAELEGQVNGFKNSSNLWHYNAVEEHKKFVQVDQQITELKEKHKTEVEELLCLIRDKENNFNRAFDSKEKEIRHHKYKRCLDKAAYWLAVSFNCIDYKHQRNAEKNHYRWLHLAVKFKEDN